MKISISLSERDLAALDSYVEAAGLPSRSAGLRHAVQLLHAAELERDYQAAWQEWVQSGAAEDWEATTGDGLDRAAR